MRISDKYRKKALLRIPGVLLGMLAAVCLYASPVSPKWEKVQSMPASETSITISGDNENCDLRMGGNSILYLALTKPMSVKVVTILGQPVSHETLQPGVYRLRLSVKGIYIVKMGSVTRKIVI